MKLEYIQYFIEVAKSGSISAAAKKLYISQSTLSSAISTLEAELGYPLLHRSSVGTSLTDEGGAALVLMEDILQKADSLQALRPGLARQEKENICVGVYPCLCSYLGTTLSEALAAGKQQGIMLSVKDSLGITDVLNGSADILICHCEENEYPYYKQILNSSNYLMAELFWDQPCCYVSENSPLAKREAVYAAELSDVQLGVSQCCVKQHSLKEYHKISRNVTILNQPDAVRQAVGAGNLVGIAPGCSLMGNAPRGGGLVRVPIIDMRHPLIVCMILKKALSPGGKQIAAAIREILGVS